MKGEKAKFITATINPHRQDLETVHRIVDRALGIAGCDHCGRLSLLDLHFLSDPPPELIKDGVISLEKQGF